MSIDNKEWLRTTITRLYLSGLSQEEMAQETDVSEGTVNAVLKDVVMSDDIFKLQREMAIVAKKTGISIKQQAANMAFENSIKRHAFEECKIHSVLGAINSIFAQDASLEPNTVAQMFLDFAYLIQKGHRSIHEIYGEVENKLGELNKLDEQIDDRKKSNRQLRRAKFKILSEYRATKTDLKKLGRLRRGFERVGVDIEKGDDIINVLRNIKEENFDGAEIINQVKQVHSLEDKKRKLQDECDMQQDLLYKSKIKMQENDRRLGFLAPSADIVNKLLQRGTHPNVIYGMFDVIQKHPYVSISNFSNGLDTYGSIEGAIYEKRKEFDFLLDFVSNLETQKDTLAFNSTENTLEKSLL